MSQYVASFQFVVRGDTVALRLITGTREAICHKVWLAYHWWLVNPGTRFVRVEVEGIFRPQAVERLAEHLFPWGFGENPHVMAADRQFSGENASV